MRIKEVLKEKGITQQELAERVGVSYQSIKQTLNAPSITTSTLERIATALDIPIWQFFASPNEVQKNNDGTSITCPHCGKDIKIKAE